MSIGSMLRLSGIPTIDKTPVVGDRVRHYGTKMWGTVIQVVPQQDRTSELQVVLSPNQYESLGYHTRYGGPERTPCPDCRGDVICSVGMECKERDQRPRWWATYHIDYHHTPEQILAEAEAHHDRCYRCQNPDPDSPCTIRGDLKQEAEEAIALRLKHSTPSPLQGASVTDA